MIWAEIKIGIRIAMERFVLKVKLKRPCPCDILQPKEEM